MSKKKHPQVYLFYELIIDTKVIFKIIISPENSCQEDLRQGHVRKLHVT